MAGLALFALCACDDDDGGGGGGSFNSGVDGTKKVSDLTDEEANAICRASSAYGESLISRRQACVVASLLFSEDSASCNQFAQACEQAPPEPDEDDEDCQDGVPPQLRDCDATVADMEACQIGIAQALVASIKGLSCSQAGTAAAEEQASSIFSSPDPASVPACETVRTECPGAFGGSDGTDAGVGGGGSDGIDGADAGAG
ncbi:MAG: hypothetical protein R3F43_03180 [bacterium]